MEKIKAQKKMNGLLKDEEWANGRAKKGTLDSRFSL